MISYKTEIIAKQEERHLTTIFVLHIKYEFDESDQLAKTKIPAESEQILWR